MSNYKWLNTGGGCVYGRGAWTPGRWRSVRGELVPCVRGLHLCRTEHLSRWCADELWAVEVPDGVEEIDAGDKVVVRRARIVERLEGWNDTSARLFAADCAERVLPIFERKYPDDDRPRLVVEAARRFARGEIVREELAAAWDAAWAAARAAAGAAAWDAAWDAAWAAARAAAGAAAWAAAGDAAGAAAWAAARAAAWDAAWDAAGAAAGAAAGDAAGAAAWAAAYQWQGERILAYAQGELS